MLDGEHLLIDHIDLAIALRGRLRQSMRFYRHVVVLELLMVIQ